MEITICLCLLSVDFATVSAVSVSVTLAAVNLVCRRKKKSRPETPAKVA